MDQWLEEIRAALPELVVYQQEPIAAAWSPAG